MLYNIGQTFFGGKRRIKGFRALRRRVLKSRGINPLAGVPLPVAFPLPADRVGQGGSHDQQEQVAVAFPTGVLAPRHFVGVGVEVLAGNVVVGADFSPAQAGEEAFSLIGAGVLVPEVDVAYLGKRLDTCGTRNFQK